MCHSKFLLRNERRQVSALDEQYYSVSPLIVARAAPIIGELP
jgi:hypothetical protein